MLIKAGDPGAENVTVIDSVTGKKIGFCYSVDTEKREAFVYKTEDVIHSVGGDLQPYKRIVMNEDGVFEMYKYPNPVHIEEQKDGK